jgi:uncharacterized protein YdcH (DUF465 family)
VAFSNRKEETMTESDIVKTLTKVNEAFRKLGEEHRSLDEKLSELQGRMYLTPDEEMEKKRMQKLKLLKKDQMAELVREYKTNHSPN